MKKHSQFFTGLIFVFLAWAALLIFERTLLFRAQELSLWLPTQVWFAERMRVPAGFMSVIDNLFTQFFYYPWLGALLLAALWLVDYLLTIAIFEIPKRWSAIALLPIGLLIGCTMEVGYWIFLIKTQGYLFSATVGITFALAAIWALRKWESAIGRSIGIAVLFIAFFPLFGVYALLAALLTALLGVARDKGIGRWIGLALSVVGCAAAPFCWYYAYIKSRRVMMYAAGLPAFEFKSELFLFWLPYILLFACLIALCFIVFKQEEEKPEAATSAKIAAQSPKKGNKKVQHVRKPLPKQQIANAGFAVLAVLLAVLFWYKDLNFHTELKIEAAMDKMDYKGVLEAVKAENKVMAKAQPRYIKQNKKYTEEKIKLIEAQEKGSMPQADLEAWDKELTKKYQRIRRHTEPTRLIVMAKNLALLKLGRSGDEMFHYLDGGAKPATPLDIRMMQVGGKMLYYNYARLNFCYRWCLEDGVEYGWKTEYLKYMTKTSLLSGEYKVAQKYVNTLSKTLFHKKWAAKYQTYIDNPSEMSKDKEFASIRQLYCYEDQLDGDNSLVEIYLLNYFSHSFADTTTPMFDEMGMMCALTLKDIPTFWQNFFRYATSHKTERMPTHFQEAALLYGNLEPGKVDISKMPFDKPIEMKFKSFMECARKNAMGDYAERDPEIRQKFYNQFHDTYYYFYFFIRDVKSY